MSMLCHRHTQSAVMHQDCSNYRLQNGREALLTSSPSICPWSGYARHAEKQASYRTLPREINWGLRRHAAPFQWPLRSLSKRNGTSDYLWTGFYAEREYWDHSRLEPDFSNFIARTSVRISRHLLAWKINQTSRKGLYFEWAYSPEPIVQPIQIVN